MLNREQDEMEESLRRLRSLLPEQPQEYFSFIISIDEYVELGKQKLHNDPLSQTMLDCLLYALDQCRRSLVVAILLSTSSSSSFGPASPPTHVAASSRKVVLSRANYPPPFVYLHFDRWRGPIVEEGALLSEVCQLDRIARYGRPL